MTYRGGTAKLYYNAPGSGWDDGEDLPSSPTWVELKRIVDVSFEGDAGSADVSSRESDWELTVPALKNGRISFGFRPKTGADAPYEVLANAFLNDTKILFAMMDQAIATSGAKGWRVICRVESFGEEQPNADGAMINVTLAPCPAFDASAALIEPARLTTS